MHRLLTAFLLWFALSLATAAGAEPVGTAAPERRAPTGDEAAALFTSDKPVQITRDETGVPGWTVRQGPMVLGYVGSTWELAGSVGYSGRPLDVLVAVTPRARIAGALLVAHNEPVLTLGISDADIAAYVSGFAGHDLTRDPADQANDLPDVISRATVSTGVIRDGILRSARTLAIGRGLMAGGGGIDRIT